ncbi:hypothetical protein HFP89_05150 [Wenzhouxiangella sp. XN79A]|uniref:hypothetical protein n=1 Tax=Wenzhouxiangella sp. XN79A TaxID=2724193 RepID=UPI00144A4EE2|nr:hypothetical protein [Wenzhouxiangella sp. XN79A]NKI34548.1 hypothetical protein [Wenzhouxiangella sp. XN79A]
MARDARTQPLRVPLLLERLDALNEARREHWLDLGRAQPALIERLARGPNRLVVADFAAPDTERGLPGTVPAVPSTGFDVVLAWDWPNYLVPEGLSRLGAELARCSHAGTVLHALIHYRNDRMPETPQRLRLAADGRLDEDGVVEHLRPAPRYSPKALEKAMCHWQVDRTLLLNNGMQEFVLRLRSTSAH